jgi:hypothetical protein
MNCSEGHAPLDQRARGICRRDEYSRYHGGRQDVHTPADHNRSCESNEDALGCSRYGKALTKPLRLSAPITMDILMDPATLLLHTFEATASLARR